MTFNEQLGIAPKILEVKWGKMKIGENDWNYGNQCNANVNVDAEEGSGYLMRNAELLSILAATWSPKIFLTYKWLWKQSKYIIK